MLVTAKELNRIIDAKRREKSMTYKRILDSCLGKVKRCAQLQQYRCTFDIPTILVGEALYKLQDAIVYLVDRLTNECGMLVRYIPPTHLYISWSYDEIIAQNQVRKMPALAPIPPRIVPDRARSLLFHPSHVNQNQKIDHKKETDADPPTISKWLAPPQPSRMRSTRLPCSDESRSSFKSMADFNTSGKFVLNLE